MAENVGGIFYTVDIETSKTLQSERKINDGLDRMQKGFDDTDKAARKFGGGLSGVASGVKRASDEMASGSRSASMFGSAMKVALTYLGGREVLQAVEEWTKITNRLKLVTQSSEELAQAQQNIFQVAQETRQGLTATADVYQKIAQNQKALNLSGAEMVDITRTINQTLVISGASAQAAESALLQLGQGLASGVIRGEEFNSISEQSPALLMAVARALNMSSGELRTFAQEGGLTAELFIKAVQSQGAVVDEQFGKMEMTISGAMTQVNNAFTLFIGKMDDSSGASQGAAEQISNLAKVIQDPKTIQAAQELAGGIATAFAAIINVSTDVVNVVRWMADEAAAAMGGVSGDDIVRLEDKLSDLERRASNIQAQGNEVPQWLTDEMAKYGQMIEMYYKLQANPPKPKPLATPPATASAPGTIAVNDPKAATKAATDAEKLAKAINSQVAELQLQSETLGMSASELAIYKLELAGATDEQIRAAQSSLSMIDAYKQQAAAQAELKRQQEAFGPDIRGKILGDVDPLSGGAFDDQTARYEAEAEAEKARYAEQLANLQQAKALELEVKGGYQALELEMAQTHANRLAQIDQAKNQVMLQSGQQLFEGLAGATAQFAGEQSSAYKAMFAVSKAFVIADAALQLKGAIAKAANTQWPLNIAAIAQVASLTGTIMSGIQGITMSGKAQGGPVQSDKMYRINETGAPEIFNAANGRQYMMPNTRGDVVSNKDATGGSNGGVVVNVQNNASGATATATSRTDSDRRQIIDIVVSDIMAGGKIAGATNRVTGTRRAGA